MTSKTNSYALESESEFDRLEIYSARLEQAASLFERGLGSSEGAKQFARDFILAIKEPGAVVFHNKFLITARKPSDRPSKVRLVRS